ncbi:hypothetical protein ACP70R_011068 [Stipagrostis hirtigluma subsp. patula]
MPPHSQTAPSTDPDPASAPVAAGSLPALRRRLRRRSNPGTTPAPVAAEVFEGMPRPPCEPSTSAPAAASPDQERHVVTDEPREDPEEEYERLKRRMEVGKKLASKSELVSRVARFLGIDCYDYGNRVLQEQKPFHFIIYKLGRIRYSWIACFRLGVSLILRETFFHNRMIQSIEVVGPTIDSLESKLMVELGCTVNVSVEQSPVINNPTLLFMPYPDRVFFENLLQKNWSVDRLQNLVVIGYSFNAMADFIEQNIRYQMSCGTRKQCKKVGRILAIRRCVKEIRACGEIDGIEYQDVMLEDLGQCCSTRISAFDERRSALFRKDKRKRRRVHLIARPEWVQNRRLAGCSLLYMFSVYFFTMDHDTDMTANAPYGLLERVLSTINIELHHEYQQSSRYLQHDHVYIKDKDLKEAHRWTEEVCNIINAIRSSSMYANLCTRISSDQGHKQSIERVLGHHDHIQMVIYAFDSIEYSVSAQYQLAFALLLKENSDFRIGEIEIFGSALTPADIQACLDLHIRVLLVDEQCRRIVERPTFFLFLGSRLSISWLGILYESNFSALQLNQMIVGHFAGETIFEHLKMLDNLVKEKGDGSILHECQLEEERARYILAADRNLASRIHGTQQHRIWTSVRRFQFDFFHVHTDAHLTSSLPRVTQAESFLSDFEMEMQYSLHLASDCVAEYRSWQYFFTSLPFNDPLVPCEPFFGYPGGWSDLFRERVPANYRRCWSHPPMGWIKLNFHGVGSAEDTVASFGFVFHNEKGEEISYYSAPLGDVDCKTANVEALRHGLKWMLACHDPVRKLIIESDDRTAIHWLNAIFPPPVELQEKILEIFVLASRIPSKSPDGPWPQREYIALHVDKKANERAIHLANEARWLRKEYFNLNSSWKVVNPGFEKTALMPSCFQAKKISSQKANEMIARNGPRDDEKFDYLSEMLAKLIFWGNPNPP